VSLNPNIDAGTYLKFARNRSDRELSTGSPGFVLEAANRCSAQGSTFESTSGPVFPKLALLVLRRKVEAGDHEITSKYYDIITCCSWRLDKDLIQLTQILVRTNMQRPRILR
jgi:hypothetical protein